MPVRRRPEDGSASAYIQLPQGWKRISRSGPGPFATGENLHRPDGRVERWESGLRRKGSSAVASLLEPSSGEPVSARIANAGTSFGGVCFLIGAVLLMPESAQAEHAQGGLQVVDASAAPATP